MEFHLVQNRKENCHRDHIPFNFKGNRILVFSVYIINSMQKYMYIYSRIKAFEENSGQYIYHSIYLHVYIYIYLYNNIHEYCIKPSSCGANQTKTNKHLI